MPLSEDARKENYRRLLQFADIVREKTSVVENARIEVVNDTTYGFGVRAAEDIAAGSTVGYYGGPWVLAPRGPSTHAIQAVDHEGDISASFGRVIDAEILSAAFAEEDSVLSREQKEKLHLIAMGLVNASNTSKSAAHGRTDTQDRKVTEGNANCARADENVFFRLVDGVGYAAQRFEAKKPIKKGDDVLWFYAWSDKPREDALNFKDTSKHAPLAALRVQTTKRLKVEPVPPPSHSGPPQPPSSSGAGGSKDVNCAARLPNLSRLTL
jgi:hypothetical protein